MDSLTHAVMGATAGHLAGSAPRGGERLSVRARLLLGGVAAAFPDIDFIAFPIDPLRFLADWHQGPTHSLILLPLWALMLGGACCAATRSRRAFGHAVLVSALGLATHIVLDVITAYGTRLLYPLSTHAVSLGTTFVFDPLFSAIVLAALLCSLRFGRRRYAVCALLVLFAYVGLQGWLKQRALQLAADAVSAAGPAPDRLDAVPQPFSPFNWKLIVSQGTRYRIAHVNLIGHRVLVPRWSGLEKLHESARAYLPPAQMTWQQRTRFGSEPLDDQLAQALWMRPDFAAFRRFAVYPALSRVDSAGERRCVWFTDLRYDLPAWPDTFRYGYCRDGAAGAWRMYRLRYFSPDDRQLLD